MSQLEEIVTKSLPDSLDSEELEFVHLRFSFLMGLGLFVLGFPFYRSKKSFFDPVAARRVVRIARFFILLELLLVIVLFIFYFEYGSPLKINQQFTYADTGGSSQYGRGESWLYGYGRPTAMLVLIGVGLVAEVHPAFRFVCLLACMGEVMSAAFSAVQVRDYYRQVRFNNAPDNGYSLQSLLVYYWREIISVGLCTMIMLLMAQLLCVVGCCDPQILPAALISGKDLDRFSMMQQQRERRRIMEVRGALGPVKDGTGKAAISAANRGIIPKGRPDSTATVHFDHTVPRVDNVDALGSASSVERAEQNILGYSSAAVVKDSKESVSTNVYNGNVNV